ncbi:hypothetical protein [Pseudarthrobacter enclensis]|uniref:Uncharacterized protein n=1 Tax=Pseudarthrobacter enclensis TaxID=993070 RepID=A0ABT9RXZ3_9MICC|nr:hypothetical protein [Pseudarthrobacter enclensis]MDP9890121.1 hypothetical protein [Pseudarthrobacter enclensis]
MPITAAAPNSGLPHWPAPEVLHVVAQDAESLQNGLDDAVQQLRAAAMAGDRRGILITRRSRSLFTVEASRDVPYGTTLENDRWHRETAPS